MIRVGPDDERLVDTEAGHVLAELEEGLGPEDSADVDGIELERIHGDVEDGDGRRALRLLYRCMGVRGLGCVGVWAFESLGVWRCGGLGR
jgi:hypothetical protein